MLGITNSSMTHLERMHAVSEYWRIQNRKLKSKSGMYKKIEYPMPQQESTSKCNCDGAGWYYLLMPSGEQQLKKCHCGKAGVSATVKKLNTELSALSNKTFDNFIVRRPYTALPDATVATQQMMVDIAYKKAIKFANTPHGWIYIHGNPGTGKSHLAASIANHVAQKFDGWTVIYRSMPAMLDIIRDSMHQGQIDKLFIDIANADIAIIDDIGADGTPTEWAEARIFRLINDRVDKPTVFTSNVDIAQLPYNARIIDRLNSAQRCWIQASSMRKPE